MENSNPFEPMELNFAGSQLPIFKKQQERQVNKNL
jgi:hypothetical protein